MSEARYGDQIGLPQYIKNLSGLDMPASLQEARARVMNHPYLVAHHFGRVIDAARELSDMERTADFISAFSYFGYQVANRALSIPDDWLTPLFTNDTTRIPLSEDPGYENVLDNEIGQVQGIEHTFREDVQGDRRGYLQMMRTFEQSIARNQILTIGINNNNDPFCMSMNVSATGSHCHLESMQNERHLGLTLPTNNCDSAYMLGAVRWYVYACRTEYNPVLAESLRFYGDLYNGNISFSFEQVERNGRMLTLPQVSFDIGNLLEYEGEDLFDLIDLFLKVYGIQYATSLMGLGISDQDIQLADEISATVTLNNFMEHI